MSDIGSLVDSVMEKEEPREVFVCEYPVFREIYRVEARRIRRTGIAEYMLLITIEVEQYVQVRCTEPRRTDTDRYADP